MTASFAIKLPVKVIRNCGGGFSDLHVPKVPEGSQLLMSHSVKCSIFLKVMLTAVIFQLVRLDYVSVSQHVGFQEPDTEVDSAIIFLYHGLSESLFNLPLKENIRPISSNFMSNKG